MKEKTSLQDNLTVTIMRSDDVVQVIKPRIKMSLLERVLSILHLKPCTGDIVVNDGITKVATFLTTTYGYGAYGSDGTDATIDEHGLIAKIACSPITSSELKTTNVVNDTAVFNIEFVMTEPTTIAEFVLCANADGSDIFCRETFPIVMLRGGDRLMFQLEVVVS